VLLNQSVNRVEFDAGKPGARLQSHRFEPKLRLRGVALNVDVWRFVPVARVKEKAVRAGT
jgi:hypothetical protein